MKKVKNIFPWFALLILVYAVFRNWFSFSEVSSGDAPFYFLENIAHFPWIPYLWNTRGLGQPDYLIYPFFYLVFPLKLLSQFHFPWVLIERLVWYWPFLFIGGFSSLVLINTVLPGFKFRPLGALIYLLNSYILMTIGGGQISIALSYALFPLILALTIKLLERKTLRMSIIFGLALALQISLEPRIGLISIFALSIFVFWEFRMNILKYFDTFFIPFIIVVGIHSFWILPLVFSRANAYQINLSDYNWANYLSFARLENSISLLQPNWPENIFGKVYFMRWEFLGLPILAYSSLFFLDKKTKRVILFVLLGLIGSFLAKGTNEPFGQIYSWLFQNFPLLNLFRDSTKFYVLVALSYSVLIPFTVFNVCEWVAGKNNLLQKICLILITSYLLILIKPAIFGQLGGTFKERQVPKEYVNLKNLLTEQPKFFRTFWLPKKHRFGFYSDLHPAVNGNEYFSTTDLKTMVEKLGGEETRDEFINLGIQYVVIPHDSEGEFFLNDRKYSQEERNKTEKELDKISWLKKVKNFSDISLYQTSNFKDRFWFSPDITTTAVLSWQMVNPAKYIVRVNDLNTSTNLIFSESFNPGWVASINDRRIPSQQAYERLNSFPLDNTKETAITVEFTAQKYVYAGLIISGATLLISLIFLVVNSIKLGKVNLFF